MNEFTIDDLRRIMRQCAGEDESLNLDGEVLDLSFADLGYDSVALMETTSRIVRLLGITAPEDEMEDVSSPREYLSFVNSRLAKKV